MHITKKLSGVACCLGLILVAPAFGDTLTYTVTVNTSSVAGTTGYMDVGLDPGSLGALGVTATIGYFNRSTLSTNTTTTGTTNGTNLYYIDGDVYTSPASSPILLSNANTLNLVNLDSNNELTQALTFGPQVVFQLILSGPGVSINGHASGTSGTTFILDFLNDAQTAYLLSSDPTGSTASLWATDLINISNTGAVTVVENPGPGGGPALGIVGLVPEPATWMFLAGGLLGMALLGRKSLQRRMRGA